MSVDDKELEDFMPATELNWTDGAINRMKNVPFFVRKSVVRGIEQYAKDKGVDLIDDEVVSRARQEREGGAMAKARAEKQAQEQVKADDAPEKKSSGSTSTSLYTSSTRLSADFPRKSATPQKKNSWIFWKISTAIPMSFF